MKYRIAAILLFAAGVASCAADAPADHKAQVQGLLAEKAPAFVNLRYLLKIKSRFGETETERDINAVMIEPDGLILCADSQITGVQPWAREGANLPSDIRVIIGEDTEGLPARIIARDSELDLAWLRIKAPAGRVFAAIDLSKSTPAEIGERLFSINRLDKYYDRTPVVREGHVGGITGKPRRAYVPSAPFAGVGLPVFKTSGELVGVSVALMPEREEIESGQVDWRNGYGLILPAEVVARATQQAKEADQAPADKAP